MAAKSDDRARIMANVSPVPECGCWLWLGRLSGDGYGRAHYLGRETTAHRAMFHAVNGEWPKELHHHCRVRSCVNPDHLRPIDRTAHQKLHPRQRAERCQKGHVKSAGNIVVTSSGAWACRQCRLESSARFKAARIAGGFCRTCLNKTATAGRKNCVACRAWRAAYTAKHVRALRAAGVCVTCKKAQAVIGGIRCAPCRARLAADSRRNYAAKRAEALCL